METGQSVRCTDCGLTHITDDRIMMKLKERAGLENEKEVDAMGFGTIEEYVSLIYLVVVSGADRENP